MFFLKWLLLQMQGHAMYNVYIYNVLYKMELKSYKQSFGGTLQ